MEDLHSCLIGFLFAVFRSKNIQVYLMVYVFKK